MAVKYWARSLSLALVPLAAMYAPAALSAEAYINATVLGCPRDSTVNPSEAIEGPTACLMDSAPWAFDSPQRPWYDGEHAGSSIIWSSDRAVERVDGNTVRATSQWSEPEIREPNGSGLPGNGQWGQKHVSCGPGADFDDRGRQGNSLCFTQNNDGTTVFNKEWIFTRTADAATIPPHPEHVYAELVWADGFTCPQGGEVHPAYVRTGVDRGERKATAVDAGSWCFTKPLAGAACDRYQVRYEYSEGNAASDFQSAGLATATETPDANICLAPQSPNLCLQNHKPAADIKWVKPTAVHYARLVNPREDNVNTPAVTGFSALPIGHEQHRSFCLPPKGQLGQQQRRV